MKHIFRTYDSHGRLVDTAVTMGANSYNRCVAAYQQQLNTGHLLWVDVTCDNPNVESVRMMPNGRERVIRP